MKILFKNKTKYNKEIYTEFLQFHQKEFGLRYTLYTSFIIVMLLILIAMQIQIHSINLAILSCLVIIIFFLWRYLHPASKVSKEFNSKKIKNKKDFTFIFYDKNFKIIEKNKSESYIVKYTNIYKVFETNNFFYIYTDKTHSLLVYKNGFTIGTKNEFSEFIQKKCRFNFKKTN